MTVRLGRTDDAERVAELTRQLGYEAPAYELARRIERRDGARAVFVADEDDGVLGWVAICIEDGFVEGRQAWIEGFVVDERVRSAGVGAQLLEVAEAWARERQCTIVRVQSNVLRERAHAFYERHGYAKIKAQFAFRKAL